MLENTQQKKKYLKILIIIAVVFALIYSYLPLSQSIHLSQINSNSSLRFNTPDEVINYYFTNQWLQTGEFFYFQPLNQFYNRILFPRWAYVNQAKVTPGNFLGIDLVYGSLAQVFGSFIVPFLTAMFATLLGIFFFLFLNKIFKPQVAFLSSILFYIFPGVWYFSSRSMFPNILFIFLILAGLYFLVKLFKQYSGPNIKSRQITLSFLWSALSGLFLGLGLTVRSSEFVWVLILVMLVLVYFRRQIKVKILYLVLSFIVFLACFIPIFYHHQILYDNFLSTGYPTSTVTSNLESGEVGAISFLKALICPFGFHPSVFFKYVFPNYFLKLFWPWCLLFVVGVIFLFKQTKDRAKKYYLITLLFLSAFLAIYYGSWFFEDSLAKNTFSIGSSYVRYFLPLYIISLPLVAMGISKLASFIKSKKAQKIVLLILPLALLYHSIHLIYLQGDESLIQINKNLQQYQIQNQHLVQITKPIDVFYLSPSADKIFFPERKNIIIPQGGVEFNGLNEIAQNFNLYYFHHNSRATAKQLNQEIFNQFNLKVDNPQSIKGGGLLFELSQQNKQ